MNLEEPEIHYFLTKYPEQIMKEKEDDFLYTIDANEVTQAHVDFYDSPSTIELTLLSDIRLEEKLKRLTQ